MKFHLFLGGFLFSYTLTFPEYILEMIFTNRVVVYLHFPDVNQSGTIDRKDFELAIEVNI